MADVPSVWGTGWGGGAVFVKGDVSGTVLAASGVFLPAPPAPRGLGLWARPDHVPTPSTSLWREILSAYYTRGS